MAISTSSFKLVSQVSLDDPSCKLPVKKFISQRTGMRLYVCQVSGPVVEGYFSLATEASDDDGLPHTLEHMIFLGSEDYPFAGVLDILANKIYAAGNY
jgi:Zn-dependent M16 (insulinase) family peptidase